MMFDAEYIDKELRTIAGHLRLKVRIYLIGGCAMSFRGIKESTKDIDVVFRTEREYRAFCDALMRSGYEEFVKMIDEYGCLQAMKMCENKDGFHFDLFLMEVCKKLNLSKSMAGRAEPYNGYGVLSVFLVSKEDIFLFKSLASEGRKRDLDDMKSLYPNLDWNVMLREIKSQRLSDGNVRSIIERFEEFKRVYELDVPILTKLKEL